jgi:tRNA(Ser,Leu) C12 N-acetylase TAN1
MGRKRSRRAIREAATTLQFTLREPKSFSCHCFKKDELALRSRDVNVDLIRFPAK